jgi:hypothetical protein
MLEILLIWFLARKIGSLVNDKGYSALPFQVMFVLLWIGGELFGAVAGAVLSQGRSFGPAYLLALVGAAGGAGVAFIIAAAMPAQGRRRSFLDDERDYRDGRGRRDRWDNGPRRRRVYREDDDYDRPRRRARDDRYREEDDYERPRRRREDEEDRPRRRDDRYREEDDPDRRRRFGREEY